MNLLIVESPAKAKTISKYLDKSFTVRASVGHVRDLPKSNKKAIDIEAGFVPHYEITPEKEAVVDELQILSKKANNVILATDPDREGEAIAWHISQAIGLKKPSRVVFHEVTKDAILEAMKHPRTIDQNLRKAQEARRVIDRLVGYDLSGLIWKKVRYGLSAGRVQSPALRILMEREREIRAFKSEKYWAISADVATNDKKTFTIVCSKEPRDKKEIDKILITGKKKKWFVKDMKETNTQRRPRAPFITSTLQQAASSRFGFPPSKTMSVAQRLYEAGLITYMRTDSTNLSTQSLKQISNVIQNNYGKEYFHAQRYYKKSRNAQEAHEAIRPTNVVNENAGGSPEQKKLYQLIWQRAVASQMADAKIMRTKIVANVDGSLIPDFSANGSRILFDGWLKIDPFSKKEDVELPKVTKGDKLKLVKMGTEEKETQPPTRYSEAGLVRELEKRGIGRPSTYAPIIRTLKDRGYVEKINNALHPTDTGDVVSSFLEKNFKKYVSDLFTAEVENKLDAIAEGKSEYGKTLKNFYGPFAKDVKAKEDTKKITNLGKADSKHKCPMCGASMIIKLGKSGKFMSCSKFPKCTGARTINGEAIKGPKELKIKCPECGGPLVEKHGKFGKFIACSNYPKCKYIRNDPKEEAKKKTGVKCPLCEKGEMMERTGRFGIFYSCTDYPDCRYAIKAKPTGKKCTFKRKDKGGKPCGALMMEGTKTIPTRCSDKTCPNHNPHKLNEK